MAAAWVEVNSAAPPPPSLCTDDAPVVVSLEAFLDGILYGHGSAGWDGWSAAELRGLARACPNVFVELLQLLNLYLRSPASVRSDSSSLFIWRVVGVPKPKDPGATRPIAIASALVRGFHRALLSLFPPLPARQWCGLSGSRTADAITDWLAQRAHKGAEFDLRRAFDSVAHIVSLLAGRSAGLNEESLIYFSELVWPAPRRCSVAGSPPPRDVWPLRGLPQGDPASPLFLAYVLAPWTRLVSTVPGVVAHLHADDRSLSQSAKATASKKPSASPPGLMTLLV